MILTRTPFRVSFVGGGSDLREFYGRNGYGAVISAAIKQYMYIAIHPYFHDKIRIKYSRTEDVDRVDEVQHPIVRECLRRVGVARGIEIASFADVASGTGLGSSSAFTVGLLHALYAFRGKNVTREQLAAEACEIEIDILGEPIGKQDQYAAALGGLNHIRFNADESVEVSPLSLSPEARGGLEKNLGLYYLGGNRQAGDILREQKENILRDEARFENLKNLVALVDKVERLFAQDQIDALGGILDEAWQQKKKLGAKVTNALADDLYERARRAGGEGGKLLGAGSTGFFLFQHRDHQALKAALDCRTLPFEIDNEGTRVIFWEG